MVNLIVGLGWLLDVLSLKPWSNAIFATFATPSDPDYPVHRAIWHLLQAGRLDDARRLACSRWEWAKSPRTGRDFIHILLKQKQYDRALEVAREMSARDPGNAWLRLLAADVCRFFIADEDAALAVYLDAVPACEAAMPDVYPQAVLYKRLTGIYRQRGDEERLLPALERFYSLAPTNFHDEEFVLLAEMRLARGDREGAQQVLEAGFEAMPRCVPLRQAYEHLGFGEAPPIPPLKTPLPEITGVTRLPVKTELLTEADGPVETVLKYAKRKARPGDTVTLSSCVAAIMEGRMLMEGTLRTSHLARLLSRFIAGAHAFGRFGASAPMANPLSAQTALEEVGTLRVLVAAAAGAIGKLFKVSGWFYVVSGAQVAQIDDILGSIPPYDYYVIMGPKDPFALSNRIAGSLKVGVKAAVVDANDLGIAWAVGYSDGVDAKALEGSMSDNPAGNQDQMTPVVIVRPKKQAGAAEKEPGEDEGERKDESKKKDEVMARDRVEAQAQAQAQDVPAARPAESRFAALREHAASLVGRASPLKKHVGALAGRIRAAMSSLASRTPAVKAWFAKAGGRLECALSSVAVALRRASMSVAARLKPAVSRLLSGVPGRAVLAAVVLVTAFGVSTLAGAGRRAPVPGVVIPGVPVPVLLYHDITAGGVSERGMAVPLSEFEEQMALLKGSGYTAITVRELQANLTGKGALPPKPVLITFDDGYEALYTMAYPALKSRGLKATAFVVGTTLETPNHLTFEEIREMTRSGVIEIGSHTYAGHGRTSAEPAIRSWTEDDLSADFRALTALFLNRGISSVPALAYPYGKPSDTEVEVARRSGFLVGFTTDEGIASRDDSPMLQKRITIWPGNSGSAFLEKVGQSSVDGRQLSSRTAGSITP